MTTPSALVSSQAMQDVHREELLVEIGTNMAADELKPRLSTSPKPGTKRLFSNRDSRPGSDLRSDENTHHGVESLPQSAPDSDEDFESCDDMASGRQSGDNYGRSRSTEKRHRTSDWPLKNKAEVQGIQFGPPAGPRGRFGPPNLAPLQRRALSQPRPSKFIEGSMNDRISHKPQHSFIGEAEELLNRSKTRDGAEDNVADETHLSGLTYHSNRSVDLSMGGHKSEAPRQSTIFRFGKSLASAFNPSSWRIWPKTRDEEDKHGQKVWDERREKAEKAYGELKRTKKLGQPMNYSTGEPRIKHDSGVEFHDYQSTDGTVSHRLTKTLKTPANEKRYGQVFLDPPSVPSRGRSESPSYESVGAPRTSSFAVRKPLAQTNDLENRPQIVRRLPSRKDLQKQQKLVKRVSDLEGKLEAARRQLAEALGQPLPNQAPGTSRQYFTPGTLASLPSEGLLSAYEPPNSETGGLRESNGVGIALSTEDEIHHPDTVGDAGEQDFHSHFHASSTTIDGLSLQCDLANSKLKVVTQASQQPKLQHREAAEEDQVEHTPRNAQKESNARLESPKEFRKKKKGIGLGNTDSSGTYQAPKESDADDSYEVIKPSPPKRRPGRPRKLKKTGPDSRSLKAEVGLPEKPGPGPDQCSPKSYQGRNRSALSGRMTTLAASHSRIPRKGRLSASPTAPSSSVVTKIVEEEEEQRSPGGATIFKAESPGVPSHQVKADVCGGAMTYAGNDTKAGKVAMVSAQEHADAKQSFEWPEDVF